MKQPHSVLRWPTHSRVAPTKTIPLYKLISDKVRDDPIFHKYYVNLLEGKISAGLTRLDEKEITNGFYVRDNGSVENVLDFNPDFIDLLESMIRRGHRPLLHIYWSPLSPKESKFVCADDQVTLAAYRKCKIRYVPCLIMAPKRDQNHESAVLIRGKGDNANYFGFLRKIHSKFPAIVVPDALNPTDILDVLISRCSALRQNIREFHVDGGQIHYHQTIHAAVRNHEDILRSVKILIENGHSANAMALARVAYEGFLNFYVDWLSPEFFGPRLHYNSIHKVQTARRKSSRTNLKQPSPRALMGSLVDLIDKTSVKAELSPLGTYFYDVVYPALSLISHQDYSEIQSETMELPEVDLQHARDRAATVASWLNVITAALLTRAGDDVGIPTKVGAPSVS